MVKILYLSITILRKKQLDKDNSIISGLNKKEVRLSSSQHINT